MDISYIFSADELFTLVSAMFNNPEGENSVPEFLKDAKACDLDRLVKKGMAKTFSNGEIELTPIVNMLIDALAFPDNIQEINTGFIFESNWIKVKCETYPFNENHYKLTPINIQAT